MPSVRKKLDLLQSGVLEYIDPALSIRVIVFPAEVDGRYVVDQLQVIQKPGMVQGVRSTDLRNLRVDPIEAMLNNPRWLPFVRASVAGQSEVYASPDPGPFRHRVPKTLVVPTTSPYPSAFYQRVAAVYMHAIETGERPALVLAEATGRPVSTCRRWVVECRRRGFLRPGRKGKAG